MRYLALLLLPTLVCAADVMTPVGLGQVKAGGEIGRRVDVTLRNNLLVIDLEKDFLQPFANKKASTGYVGLGKLIDSAVRLAANTGDARAIEVKKRLVSRTLEMQEPDGYIGLMSPQHRITGMWDVHEMGYVLYGLLSDYEFFGEKKSLEGARRGADFILANWKRITPEWIKNNEVAEHVAVTGIERTMLALSRATGDARYRDFVTGPRALPTWNMPVVIGRRFGIEGHIYAYMARSLAQLELYRERPQPSLLVPTRRAIDFLTHHNGMAITGGAGQWEIWTNDQEGRGELGETCATAYQLRVYDSLLRMEGDARYGEMMERTIYNALFAAQSPDGRRIRYYSPTEGPRVYHPTDTYCCPCNYRRIVADLPAMIYYRAKGGVAVNLFTASEAKLDVAGAKLSLRQQTEYPSKGDVALSMELSAPARFPLRLRIPLWAKGARVSVNGAPAAGAVVPGAFFEIAREWKSGDAVSVVLPMRFRLVAGRERQAGRAAVMRGPLVFCLNPAQSKALAALDGADLGRYAIDPESLGEVRDDSVRPGGVAARVGAWKAGYSLSSKHELTLTLTEFPDPDGKATYFRLRNPALAVADELTAK